MFLLLRLFLGEENEILGLFEALALGCLSVFFVSAVSLFLSIC